MHVSTILKSKGSAIITVKPEDTVASAARLLSVNKIGAVLAVGTDNAIAGILSERDIVRGLADQGARVLEATVGDLMTRRVVTCRPEDTCSEVLSLMTAGRFRHLPVLENGRLVGVISIGDVVKRRLEEVDQEVESLKDYVAGRI